MGTAFGIMPFTPCSPAGAHQSANNIPPTWRQNNPEHTTVCVYTTVETSNVMAAPVSVIGKETSEAWLATLQERRAVCVHWVSEQCFEFIFCLVFSFVVKSSGSYMTSPPLTTHSGNRPICCPTLPDFRQNTAVWKCPCLACLIFSHQQHIYGD